MPDSAFDQAGLSATLRAQENVLSRQQALGFGMWARNSALLRQALAEVAGA